MSEPQTAMPQEFRRGHYSLRCLSAWAATRSTLPLGGHHCLRPRSCRRCTQYTIQIWERVSRYLSNVELMQSKFIDFGPDWSCIIVNEAHCRIDDSPIPR